MRRSRRAGQARAAARVTTARVKTGQVTTMREMWSVRRTITPLWRQSRSGRRLRRGSLPPRPGEQPEGSEPPLAPSPRSLRGLDWFIFFVADVQTGFGPFVSVFLTTQKWTQVDIGLVLSVSGFVSLFGQMPGGALVDAARSERFVAGVAVAAICFSALVYAAAPIFPMVLVGGGRFTRSRVACSVRRSPRSVSAWSVTPRSASGSGAMPDLLRSATASPRRPWAPAVISSRPALSSSSPSYCWCRRCSRCARSPARDRPRTRPRRGCRGEAKTSRRSSPRS